MSEPRLFLFDDHVARRWAPFTLTRPAGELLFGCLTLRERVERALGVACAGHLSRRALVGYDEEDASPVVPAADVDEQTTRILWSSRAVPELGADALDRVVGCEVPARIVVAGQLAGWVLPSGASMPPETTLKDPSAAAPDGETIEVEGRVLGRPWDLVAQNAERITRDVAALWPGGSVPEGLAIIGHAGWLSLGRDSEVEPGVTVDTRGGPVRLAEGVRVEGPARLTGPLYVGPGTMIFGGSVGTSSIGPVCKLRGEISESVLLGYVNKAHDGYLGHALLGRWVNLGALTTNSDLKNNYSTVKVWTPEGDLDTGLIKVGCFLGDHVKTGIGTVLNTGTVVGAGSNVFGGIMPPTVVPPFSWGSGPDLRDHRLDKFFETAERSVERRGERLTPGVRRLLEVAWRDTAGRRAE